MNKNLRSSSLRDFELSQCFDGSQRGVSESLPVGEMAVGWGAWPEGLSLPSCLQKHRGGPPQRETQAMPEVKPVSVSSFFILVEWHNLREQRQGCLKMFHLN